MKMLRTEAVWKTSVLEDQEVHFGDGIYFVALDVKWWKSDVFHMNDLEQLS